MGGIHGAGGITRGHGRVIAGDVVHTATSRSLCGSPTQ